MRLSYILGVLLLAFAGVELGAAEPNIASKWEKEIAALTAGDLTNPPPKNAILFVGSSSIRLWKSLAKDFPEKKVINRGFGGSQMSDLNEFVERIVLPYEPKQILVYEGDNDIASGKAPGQILEDFKAFVGKVRKKLPGVRIDFIAIKPSPSRWHLVEKTREANRLIAAYAGTGENVGYIDIFTPMLGDNGEPRPELFVEDRLHLNEKGYEIWREVIAGRLR